MKKLIFTCVFAVVVIAVALCTVFLLPKHSNQNSSSDVSSAVSSGFSSVTFEKLTNTADTVITGTIIKADSYDNGILYTFNVNKVYKGRNYTSMGYAYEPGKQNLTLGQQYLFIGVTGTEKYHYNACYSDVPWMFEVAEDGTLTNVSNTDTATIADFGSVKFENIVAYCDIV